MAVLDVLRSVTSTHGALQHGIHTDTVVLPTNR
jgi:hypothetical protein